MSTASTMPVNLEDTLAQGVEDGKIPHAVVFATNRDGTALATYVSVAGR